MPELEFPDNFPSVESMMNTLLLTIQEAWKIDMNSADIDAWLANFTGKVFDVEAERRLALWLLCNFTYYNEDEVNYLCRALYRQFIHQILTDKGFTTVSEFETIMNRIAFTSIGRASESGAMLLYHFRQEVGLSIDRFVFPTELGSDSFDIIVCIDDVMLSGGTAERFFHKHKKDLCGKSIYYLSLFTTQAAINKLSEHSIKVISCTLLDDRNKAFSSNSLIFFKYPSLKDATEQLAEEYGKLIERKKPLGHQNGQYCIGFSYNIPNNSLPIFWSSNGWNPIFQRKEKYQNAKQERRNYGYFL